MEENKTQNAQVNEAPQEQPAKYTYEELKQICSEQAQANRRLIQQIQQLQEALEKRDFDYSSFLLSMLFKVVEHPNRYSPGFVTWCTKHIEGALKSFIAAGSDNKTDETTDGSKDEAE